MENSPESPELTRYHERLSSAAEHLLLSGKYFIDDLDPSIRQEAYDDKDTLKGPVVRALANCALDSFFEGYDVKELTGIADLDHAQIETYIKARFSSDEIDQATQYIPLMKRFVYLAKKRMNYMAMRAYVEQHQTETISNVGSDSSNATSPKVSAQELTMEASKLRQNQGYGIGSHLKHRVDFGAMQEFVNEHQEAVKIDPSLLRNLYGAAKTARHAALIRESLGISVSDAPYMVAVEGEMVSERAPRFADLIARAAEAEIIQVSAENQTRFEELSGDPTKYESFRAKVSQLFENLPRPKLSKRRLALAGLSAVGLYAGWQAVESIRNFGRLDMVSDVAIARELSADELSAIGIDVGTLEPDPENKLPEEVNPNPMQASAILETTDETDKDAPSVNDAHTLVLDPKDAGSPMPSEYASATQPVSVEEEMTYLREEQNEARKQASVEATGFESTPEVLKALKMMVDEARLERRIKDPDYEKRVNLELNKNLVNVVIAGLDRSEERVNAGSTVFRADAIIIASYDMANNSVSLFRIPRDAHAPEVDDLSPKYKDKAAFRINVGPAFGNMDGFRAIIEDATGLSGDFMFIADFNGVKDFINAMGGIDMELDETFVNRYGGDFAAVGLPIHAGANHLNGEAALWFARVRHQDSDHLRGERQQKVIRTMILQMLNEARRDPKVMKNLLMTSLELVTRKRLGTAGEITLSDLLTLADDMVQSKDQFGNFESPTFAITPGSFFSDLMEGARIQNDRYQLVMKGEEVNDHDPIRYWRKAREKVAKLIRSFSDKDKTQIAKKP